MACCGSTSNREAVIAALEKTLPRAGRRAGGRFWCPRCPPRLPVIFACRFLLGASAFISQSTSRTPRWGLDRALPAFFEFNMNATAPNPPNVPRASKHYHERLALGAVGWLRLHEPALWQRHRPVGWPRRDAKLCHRAERTWLSLFYRRVSAQHDEDSMSSGMRQPCSSLSIKYTMTVTRRRPLTTRWPSRGGADAEVHAVLQAFDEAWVASTTTDAERTGGGKKKNARRSGRSRKYTQAERQRARAGRHILASRQRDKD